MKAHCIVCVTILTKRAMDKVIKDLKDNQMMESNREPKARKRSLNQEQVSYYKKLRKQQNNKRNQRKLEAVRQEELKRKEKIQVTDLCPRD